MVLNFSLLSRSALRGLPLRGQRLGEGSDKLEVKLGKLTAGARAVNR
jgi:hypothetical protein